MQQATGVLLALDKAAEATLDAREAAIGSETRARDEDRFHKAAATGIALNAARDNKLQQNRHAVATRMQARKDDYLRFARDLRVPNTSN